MLKYVSAWDEVARLKEEGTKAIRLCCESYLCSFRTSS